MTPHRLLIGCLGLGTMAAALMLGAEKAAGPSNSQEAEHRLHAGGQPRLRRTGRLRRRHPSWRAHAAHRQACRRRHAPAQLQRRSAMHALPVGAHDRPLRHPLRHLRSPDRRRSGWIDAVGGHHRRAVVGAGLRHRHMGQMASRQCRRAVSHEPGFRRVVRHPAHLRRGDVAIVERDEGLVAIGRQQAGLGREGRPS